MGINGGDDSDNKYAKEIDRLLRIVIVVDGPYRCRIINRIGRFQIK